MPGKKGWNRQQRGKERVLSIIQDVKREEGARKRGREKAGSGVGGKSLG